MASGDLSTFFVCSLLLLLCIVQASGAGLVLPICHENMIKGEFYIPRPLQCVRHNTTSIINCSADVYYPSDNFIKIPITTCELYKTTSETTTYFFGAKTNDNHTISLTATFRCSLLRMGPYFKIKLLWQISTNI